MKNILKFDFLIRVQEISSNVQNVNKLLSQKTSLNDLFTNWPDQVQGQFSESKI